MDFDYELPLYCTEVLDGDTIVAGGIRIRLLYIDAPELSQKHVGILSKEYLKKLLLHKKITLKKRGKDIYKRTLAEVYLEGEFINKKMIEEGYAVLYAREKGEREFFRLQEIAKRKRLGIYKYEFIEPSLYRKLVKNF